MRTNTANATTNKFYANVFMQQDPAVKTVVWYREYFTDFLASEGGLVISVLGILTTVMAWYQEFI